MKKIILFLTMFFNLCVLFGQDFIIDGIGYDENTIVYTCKGAPILAAIARREITSQELADTDRKIFDGAYSYLGIKRSDIVKEATAYYNCHAYAWHLTEGNTNKVWIRNHAYLYNSLDPYWSGSSACFVPCNVTEAEKIYYYYNGQHSAVKSSVSGKYDSKWGNWYVIRHKLDSVPYPLYSYRNYFAKPTISGPGMVCNNGEQFNFFPSSLGNAITWTVDGPFSFHQTNSQTTATGTSPTVYRTVAGSGNGVLKAYYNGNEVVKKTITPCEIIFGSTTICGTSNYTLNFGFTNFWGVSPQNAFEIINSTATSITVKSKSHNGETGTISAIVDGTTVYKSIQTCNSSITGSSTLCDLTPYSFFLHNASADSWSISPTNSPIYIHYSNYYWADVSSTSFYGDSATLNAINNGVVIASIPIQTCSSGSVYIYGNPVICTSDNIGIFHISDYLNSGTGDYWHIKTLSGSLSLLYPGYTGTQVYAASPGSSGILYAVSPGQYIVSYEISSCRGGGGSPSYISVYPNPVSDILTIEIDAESFTQSGAFEQPLTDGKPFKTDPVFDLRLYDGQGNLLRKAKTKGGTVEFNVSNLPDGIYYLHVYDGVNSTPVMKQIMVEH